MQELLSQSDKKDFKSKLFKKDKEGYFILINGTIYQEDISILNIYTTNSGTLNFIKQLLQDIRHCISPSSLLVSNFSMALSPSTQAIQKNKWTFCLNNRKSTFFSTAHRSFTKIHHMLGEKVNLKRY